MPDRHYSAIFSVNSVTGQGFEPGFPTLQQEFACTTRGKGWRWGGGGGEDLGVCGAVLLRNTF